VFDLDGTLLDTMVSVPAGYAATIGALGGPDVSPEQVVAAWHLGPTAVVLAHFVGRPITAEDIECFYRCLQEATDAARPYPGVERLLDALGTDGYQLAVFTSATRRAATAMLAAAGLDGYLPVIVGGDEVPATKPAPDGLLRACSLLGVSAADVVYVGDAATDLECAAAAGALGIHAAWGDHTAPVNGHPRTAREPGDVMRLLTQPG
jgi:HAD superfamily hydrolase (TIGR01549 family)